MNYYSSGKNNISFLFIKINVAFNLPSILHISVFTKSAETCCNE
jgi:hypothetical protein